MLGNGQTVTTANERSERPNDDDPYECEHKRGFGAKVSFLDGVNIIRGPFDIRALKIKMKWSIMQKVYTILTYLKL